ncbi:MAG: hypothetical protein U5K00_23105 [Melioribacteraceae bacterium]|nr:hypothetical protein [Melioribacteraceae bacterium]
MNSYYQNIVNRLKQTNRKQNLVESLTGLVKVVLIFSISILLFVLIEAVFHLGSLGRTVLVALFGLLNLVSLLALFVLPILKNLSLFSNFDLNKTAKYVGEKNSKVKDELLNAVQLLNDKSNNYSKELIEAAFKKVYERTEKFKFTGTVQFTNYKLLRYSSSVFIFTFLLVILTPFLNDAAGRIINYDKEFIEPPKYVFTVDPGNIDVTKGEDVRLEVRTTPDVPPYIELKTKTTEQAAFESTDLQPDSAGNFYYTLRSLNSSTQYFVQAEDIVTDTYKINVISRPSVRKLELNITPPSYTKLKSQKQIDNGSSTVLPGTQLDYVITSTKPLSSAQIKTDDKEIDLDVSKFEASGRITVKKEFNYTITLNDTSDIENENPVTYSIEITEDQHPQIEIVKPGENVELGLENILTAGN